MQFSLSHVVAELGLKTVYNSPRDAKLLCAQRFVRIFAYGSTALFLVLYLEKLGFSSSEVGLFMTLTLAGDTVISFVLTIFADGLGRRNVLILGSALMCFSGVVFAIFNNYWILLLGSIIGVISPSGNEIGPFRAVEESTLAQLASKEERSDIFAWYTLIGSLGGALGQILSGWLIERLINLYGWDKVQAYRVIFAVYAVLGAVKLTLALCLSKAAESPTAAKKASKIRAREADATEGEQRPLLADSDGENEVGSRLTAETQPSASIGSPPDKPIRFAYLRSILPDISPGSRTILVKLCLLFALDSFGSGLATVSWISDFFNYRYGVDEGVLGTLFSITSLINAGSNLVAASISRRIGPLKTMVFTHLPSAVFLALIPAPSSQWLSMAFLVLRSCTASMDTAPRQAFLAGAVLDSERTAVMGGVNVVRTLAQTLGPAVTGGLKQNGLFWIAFVLAGIFKGSYDLLMLALFLGFKGREDTAEEEQEEEHGETHENGNTEEGAAAGRA